MILGAGFSGKAIGRICERRNLRKESSERRAALRNLSALQAARYHADRLSMDETISGGSCSQALSEA
jgi:cytochrome c peroxidase